MRGISKYYPGVVALDNVDFPVARGEVHALVGENGAGKSTLMKILAGAEPKSRGEILLEGHPVTIDSPQRAMDLGISIIYQEFNLVPHLSAAENIFLGREPTGPLPGWVNFRQVYGESRRLMGSLGMNLDVRSEVRTLSVAQQQMVEIAKATSRQSRLIIMDEPSATLTEHELANLFALIRSLRERGVSVIYISHRLEEIFTVADRVTVFRDGSHIATRPIGEVDRDQIIRMMVGRELKESIPKQPAPIGEVLLEARGLTRAGVFRDVSFSVRRGEVVGLGGLVGAGRTEVARAIFGADALDGGQALLEGRLVHLRSPRDA